MTVEIYQCETSSILGSEKMTNWMNFRRFEFDTVGDPRSAHILFLLRLKYNVSRI
jgi:hypothetical protein